jgi:phosphomannomutase
MKKTFTALRFGTSGLRDTVENMTDMECYINTRGFLSYLTTIGEFKAGTDVALGGDRRPSTPRIMRAVAAAVRDMGGQVDDQGLTSSPALAYYAMGTGVPSIMITGSHIPADRNGIKFTKQSGEVLKSDEKGILARVAEERGKVYSMLGDGLLFDENGMFTKEDARKAAPLLQGGEHSGEAMKRYFKRYTSVFGTTPFPGGARLFLYQHSAVARDVMKEIFEALGAEVIAPDASVELDYVDESGERKHETEPLRSPAFIPVDTESVSNKTMAIFRKVMNERGLDVGISMDGDSDRPLLVYRIFQDGRRTDEVTYVTGDILGLLTVLALERMGVKIEAVAVPVSANDAIAKVLGQKGVEITQTKIGSPYVIAAMNDSLARHAGKESHAWNVFSWESNGGFLTGNDIKLNNRTLKALPTRDSALPLVAVILTAARAGEPVSSLLDGLPARFTHADRKKGIPLERGKALIKSLSPAGQPDVRQVDFRSDGKAIAGYASGETRAFKPGSEFHKIKAHLENYFTPQEGFSTITGLNYVDGVRIFFSNGEISHLRPSGNAPEFRNYAIANDPARAERIVRIGLSRIIPDMLKGITALRGDSS